MTCSHFPARLVQRFAAGLAALACAGAVQAVVVSAEASDFGGATVLGFDDVASGTSLTTQYAAQGVADFNASVLGAQGSAKALDHETLWLPATVSGQNLGYMNATIEFAGGVDRVGAWLYKYNGTQFLTALDAAQNVLMSVSVDVSSSDSSFFDFVGVRSSAKDIRYVVIGNNDLSQQSLAWNVSGHAAFYDNLSFSPIPAVPEPQTWVLMLLCLALIGATVRRRR